MDIHGRSTRQVALLAVLAWSLSWWAAPAGAQPQSQPQQDYSRAERLLFMTDQVGRLAPPVTLRYTFRKSGALESPFDDSVAIVLAREPDGACCQARGEFLSGERRLALPEIEHAEANPVLLYFLEHDVRDMQRLTRGSPAYYRKRIRMALYQAARVSDVPLEYRGRTVQGQRVEIDPYRDDPARSRFEKFARKTYEFFLADAVPGGVHGIRTVMRPEAADAAPMIVEEIALEGARLPEMAGLSETVKPSGTANPSETAKLPETARPPETAKSSEIVKPSETAKPPAIDPRNAATRP